jgi:hypothetical protein
MGLHGPIVQQVVEDSAVGGRGLPGAWRFPTLAGYGFRAIALKPFAAMRFLPCNDRTKTRKTLITDSTAMHHLCGPAGVPDRGWQSVLIEIDGWPIARVLGMNAGVFHGGGDSFAREELQGQVFESAAVVPMFRALPPNHQKRYAEHEQLQRQHLGHVRALPALMDLEAQYKEIDEVGFYKTSVKLHVRPQCFNWLIAAICDTGADLTFMIGWNAESGPAGNLREEFEAQQVFIRDFTA